MKKYRTLEHGMLLRSKTIMDNAFSELDRIKELIPECLHAKFAAIVEQFEDTLCDCDVASEYQRKDGDE